MHIDKIKNILIDHLSLKQIYVDKNAGNHYQIIVVSDQFINMSTLQRQKVIYFPLTKYILDGRIHSLSIQVFTLQEWKHECELNTK